MKPTTLITGAAKRIGAEIARHLAGLGHELVLHYHRSEAEAVALATELHAEHGTRVTLRAADLVDTDGLSNFWSGLPPVTHLVHNASSFAREPFGEFTAQQLRGYLAVNLEAPLLLSRDFVTQLPNGMQGSITVIGDGAMGASIGPHYFPYAVSKHAWQAVIELLAASIAPNARANLIALGPTLPPGPEDVAMFKRLAARMPLQQHGSPAEVAHAVAFAIASSSLTGQTLNLADGMGLWAGDRP